MTTTSDNGGADDLVTVVVPARNEERAIGACLEAILSQTHRELQVIVVDGASDDRTAEVVREWQQRDARVELLSNPAGLIPISLNLALAAARAPWLVRVDAHATVPPTYVAQVLDHLRTGRWGGVGGRKDGVGVTPAGHAIAAAMASPFGVGNSAYHYATTPQEVDHIPFGAYPTELARELGGWNEALAVNQDFEFDHRVREAGHKLLLDPELVIDWESRQSIGALFRQYHRYGRGKVAVVALHPESLRLRHLAAPALLASWAVAVPAAVAVGRWQIIAIVLAPYVAALALASLKVASRLQVPGSRRYVPAAFVAMHVGWAAGFWRAATTTLWRRLFPVRAIPAEQTASS